jgi:dTDP-4-dehydrorhamnose reductase
VILAERGASGVVHVAGPQVMNRYELALEACRVFGLDETKLTPCSTADLNQRARRPLKAGLLCPRLEVLTGLRMKTPREGLESLRKLINA